MPSDYGTFIAAFAAIYGGIALYMLHLERRAKLLEKRLAALEAAAASAAGSAAPVPTGTAGASATTANRKAPDPKAPPSP